MRLAHVPISYQTLQVLSDLRSVAAKGHKLLGARLTDQQHPTLRRAIFEQKGKLTAEDAAQIYEDLLLIAALPERGVEAFLAATAVLLADRLQDGAGTDDLSWNWVTFETRYRAAPSATRAALMNGFRWAHVTRRVTLDAPPAGADLYTLDRETILQNLTAIARAMTEETRAAICALAQDGSADVHRRALENCLNGSCRLSEFGAWFPGEVASLAARDSTHPGFAGALALLLIDAIETQDANGKMAARWEEQAEDFNLLPPELRAPFIAGVRHLHEMAFDWTPYADWPAAQLHEKAIVVPFARA